MVASYSFLVDSFISIFSAWFSLGILFDITYPTHCNFQFVCFECNSVFLSSLSVYFILFNIRLVSEHVQVYNIAEVRHAWYFGYKIKKKKNEISIDGRSVGVTMLGNVLRLGRQRVTIGQVQETE